MHAQQGTPALRTRDQQQAAAQRRVLLVIDFPDSDETTQERVLSLVHEFGSFMHRLVPGGSAQATIAPVEPQRPGPSPPPPARRPSGLGAQGLSVDRVRREVHVSGSVVDLTYKEFELLAHLSANPRRVISRLELIEAVWGVDGDSAPSQRVIDVHIRRLRGKLGRHRSAISTVRGGGYRFDPQPFSQLRDR